MGVSSVGSRAQVANNVAVEVSGEAAVNEAAAGSAIQLRGVPKGAMGLRSVPVSDAPPAPPTDPVTREGTEALRGTLDFLGGAGSGNDSGNIMAFMLAMQKMMTKEAREDKKLQLKEKANERDMKAQKVDLESTKIILQQGEAGERYDHAITAANIDALQGVASIALTALSSYAGSKSGKGWERTAMISNIANQIQQVGLPRLSAHHKAFADYQKSQGLASDKTQLQINGLQKQIDRQTNVAEEATDSATNKKDLRQRGLDNFQKMLDIIRSIQVSI